MQVVLLLAVAARVAIAAEGPPPTSTEHWRVGVDLDPSMFALHGGDGWIMLRPPSSRFRFGAGGFTLAVPGALSTLLDGGTDGWDMRLTGLMGHGSVTLLPATRGGLYTGAYVGALETTYGREEVPGVQASLWHVTVMPMVGEQWFPFHGKGSEGLYLQPWLGLSVWIPVSGDSTVGTHVFNEPPAIPFPAFHLGYEI